MAMVDHGALLRVDGRFVNKNKGLFMKSSDTGYVCDKAACYYENDRLNQIDGNYFVYAGDEKCLLVFYKGLFKVISYGKEVFVGYDNPFLSETFYIENLIDLKISRLEREVQIEESDRYTWIDYVKDTWEDCDGHEKVSDLEGGNRCFNKFMRLASRRRKKCKWDRYYTSRWLAEWDYDGRHYEVIFGYGVESDEDVWNDIKDRLYGFTKHEREVIDSWFAA